MSLPAGHRPVGLLDVVSTMPARFSVAKTSHDPPLNRLVTDIGEIAKLTIGISAERRQRAPPGALCCSHVINRVRASSRPSPFRAENVWTENRAGPAASS